MLLNGFPAGPVVVSSLLEGVATDPEPGFVAADFDDFRPAVGSPMIDAGDEAVAATDLFDVDEQGGRTGLEPDRSIDVRVRDATIDIGAFEYCKHARADFDMNSDVGFDELLAVLTLWGPCSCREDIDGDGLVGFADLVSCSPYGAGAAASRRLPGASPTASIAWERAIRRSLRPASRR